MWDDERDGRREHQGLARALDATGAPDRRAWNGHRWQEEDAWGETGLVTFPLHPGAPAALRAECQCTWHGTPRPLDGDPAAVATLVLGDWQQHIAEACAAMYPVSVADALDDLFGYLHHLRLEDPLAVLSALRELESRVEPARTATVATARNHRHSWQKVADALGVARQSAWEKYQFAGTAADVEAAYAKTGPFEPQASADEEER